MEEPQITIEYIAKTYKHVGSKKTSKLNYDRLFFLDEKNNILYCFGPSYYVRRSTESAESERVMVMEYEDGPYLQVGDNVYDDKIIRDFVFYNDQGIIITGMILEEKFTLSEEDT